MSFVNVAPELVEAAAHDLAGIGSTLGDATGFAAAPTTSIAAAGADEVSVAIAALFGNHGEEFQALTARAAAFHNEFVGMIKSGVGAYLGSEVASAGQMLGGTVAAPAQAISQSVTGLEGELEAFGAAVAAPYQTFFSNTAANLQITGGCDLGQPAPLAAAGHRQPGGLRGEDRHRVCSYHREPSQ